MLSTTTVVDRVGPQPGTTVSAPQTSDGTVEMSDPHPSFDLDGLNPL